MYDEIYSIEWASGVFINIWYQTSQESSKYKKLTIPRKSKILSVIWIDQKYCPSAQIFMAFD